MLSVEASETRKRVSTNLIEYAEENGKNGYFNDITIKAENEQSKLVVLY